MKYKATLMDEAKVNRSLVRIAHEIVEKNNGADHLCLLGIRRRGIPMAQKIAENIKSFEGVDVPVGHIDISLYRDDLELLAEAPVTTGCSIPVDVKEYTIILVDDVLYTARTVRAAIDAVFSFGRPRSIQLAILVDRGHRELPIRADYVGKNVPTSKEEVVRVMFDEYDGKTGVDLYTQE